VTRRSEQPHVRLYQAGSLTLLPPEEWEAANSAIDTELEWFHTRTLHGAKLRVRVSTITDLALITAEAIALEAAERAEAEADEEEEEDDEKWRRS
jgi:hypothetical protein